jgi:imidazoleglycerol-phosphate dehydratase
MTKINRETKETNITIEIDLTQDFDTSINTNIPFLDHMLNAFALNANISLSVQAEGDLEVDDHHVVEDVGIVLGQAVKEALKDQKITRYGTSYVPMDESLSRVVLDISNRIYLVYDVTFRNEKVGNMTLCNFKEFFRAFTNESRMTLHITNLYGENDHHKIESIFKAWGQAFRIAITPTNQLQSTKGVL